MHAFSNSSAVVGHLSTYESTEEEDTSQESGSSLQGLIGCCEKQGGNNSLTERSTTSSHRME